MKAIKKPIAVLVEFATTSSEMQTLEGPVKFAQGDALATGPAGERWPIGRERFEVSYEPVAPTRMGENGSYLKRLETVDARQTPIATEIALGSRQGTLHAKPGDWIITSVSGEQWVVADNIFRQTYELTC
ncbi:hypothetical protein AWB69_08976 [Caballeronia udeis]|uniref:Uncharacterized protein n=1 Tax=Caballeronia udeis TaxID=1232866 RepID=A0A158JY64_9BURK|nr:PGDYG domain-containing protein [Caballeronia udeis]SAL73291.1 hypothetical protein AWB69_08976 [Caballeronia udeis]